MKRCFRFWLLAAAVAVLLAASAKFHADNFKSPIEHARATFRFWQFEHGLAVSVREHDRWADQHLGEFARQLAEIEAETKAELEARQ